MTINRGFRFWKKIEESCVRCPESYKEMFHTEFATCVESNDDILFWLRANHFTIEIGWSETSDSRDPESEILILVSANNKGNRESEIFKFLG